MTYLVVHDDEAGTLQIVREAPTYDTVLDALKNMGKDNVRMARHTGLMGWVSDVGHVMPQFNRNVVGSCLTAALAAPAQPLAGPLVITGYEYPAPGEEEMGFPEPMDERQVMLAVGLYTSVLKALGMPVPAALQRFHKPQLVTAQWQEAVRHDAQLFRDAEAPSLTYGSGPLPADPAAAADAVLDLLGIHPEGVTVVGHGPVKPPYGTSEREAYDRAQGDRDDGGK